MEYSIKVFNTDNFNKDRFMELKGTDEEAKIFDSKIDAVLEEAYPDLKASPFFKLHENINIQKFRALYKQSNFKQENLPELTKQLMYIHYLYISGLFVHIKLESPFRNLESLYPEFQKIAELHFMENSIQRSYAYWEAIVNFILLFEDKQVNKYKKKEQFAQFVKDHPRWSAFYKYSERMMKFGKKYANNLKHSIPITLYYLIYGIQTDPISNDLFTPMNLLSDFWPQLIASLEGREFSQTKDIISTHPESINNSV